MSHTLRILLIESPAGIAESVKEALAKNSVPAIFSLVRSEAEFLKELDEAHDIILTDFELAGFDALRALQLVGGRQAKLPVVVVSTSRGEHLAVAAMKAGAVDFLLAKNLDRLGESIAASLNAKPREVTDRRNDEQHFQSLSRAIEQSPAIILITDTNGNIDYVNPRFSQVTGYSLSEVIGKSPALLEPENSPSANYESLWKAVASGQQWRGEFQNRKKNGELYWESASISAIYDGQGQITHYVAVKEDITEQKRVEKELRENEERFRQFAANVDQVLWMTDPSLTSIIYINRAYENVWGRTCESLRQNPKSFIESIHLDDRARVVEALQSASTKLFSLEYRVVRPDGSVRWVHNRGFPLHNEAGEVYRIAGSASDITMNKAAEALLIDQARLLDLAQDAILVRTLTGKLIFWNKGAERLYGWTSEEVLGKASTELLKIEANKYDAALMETLVRGEWAGELLHRSKSGAPIVVSSRWTLLRDERGDPKSVLVINTDISDHSKLKEQLLRAQRLESIGTLASGVAHDLNNILAPILMSTQLLEDEDLPREMRDEIIGVIKSSAQRGADVVHQVLTFARGVQGDRVPLQLTQLVREILKIGRETFPKAITLREQCAEDVWRVKGDPTQLQQVLLNLCVNSRDAMPQGGTLTLSVANADLDEDYARIVLDCKPGPYVVVTVTDSGTGIPPELLDKIFDPFFTTKDVGEGTGLGLSTVLGIVKSHDGLITVSSELDKGTRFIIYLPACSEEIARPEEPEIEPIQAIQGRNELVLLVDDEPGIRTVAETMLTQNGYRILLASDGNEALEIYERQGSEIAVVLTDLMMPGLDGIGLARKLRKINPKVKIIASTGYGKTARLAELHALDVHDFLPKPYSQHTLLVFLKEVIRGATA